LGIVKSYSLPKVIVIWLMFYLEAIVSQAESNWHNEENKFLANQTSQMVA